MNYSDNPWFPHVLELERRKTKPILMMLHIVGFGRHILNTSGCPDFPWKIRDKRFEADAQKWDGSYGGIDFDSHKIQRQALEHGFMTECIG